MQFKLFFCTLLLWGQFAYGSPQHEKNQILFTEVLNEHAESPYLAIDVLGLEALHKGLGLSCYKPGVYTLAKRENNLFVLFVWSPNGQTEIHSHPFPCAFTVLEGEMTEKKFEVIDQTDRIIRMFEQKSYTRGEKEIDLNNEIFIHQMVNESPQLAISLHVYECSSLEELAAAYGDEHIYPDRNVVIICKR